MYNLEEYLVKLGFKVDEAQWKTFATAVAKSGSLVYDLGAAAFRAAEAIGVAVEVIARRYEQLYYSSQRTGASVGMLLNYSFAATQIGVSSETARHSVESFTQALRLNPGLQGMLTNLGVGAADPVTRMQTMVERLKAQFGERGYFAAAQIANMYGLDETTFRQMWSNMERLKTSQTENQVRMRGAGLDADKAAVKFTDFARAVNRLEAAFGVLKDRITVSFAGPVQAGIDRLTKLVDLGSNLYNAWADPEHDPYGEGAASGVSRGAKSSAKSSKAAPSGASGAIDYFVKQGWTVEQATGIAANLYAESGFKPGNTNPASGMYGLAQWDKGRRGDFQAWSGHSIYGSSTDEQMAFVQHELTAGKERGAGARLRGAKTAKEAGYAFGRYYERPDLAGDAIANQRGQLAEYWGNKGGGGGAQNVTQTNNINVNGAGDPKATANAVGAAMNAQNQQMRQMIRGDTVR
jgi:hypothetical protein